jgi:hypothetical protein
MDEQRLRTKELAVGAALTLVGFVLAWGPRQLSAYASFDMLAQATLRQAAFAQEMGFANNRGYVTCGGAGCEAHLPRLEVPEGVYLSMQAGGDYWFTGTARHVGSRVIWTWDSRKRPGEQLGSMVP